MSSQPFPLDVLLDPGPNSLERLLTGWLGPAPIARALAARQAAPGPVENEPDLGRRVLALPTALAAGLVTLGRWPGVFHRNRLRAPTQVDAVDGLGRFLVEADRHAFWGFALADAKQADPRVWIEDELDGRRLADAHVSRFLLKMTLLEIILGDCTAEAGPGMSATDLVLGLTRLDTLGPLTWPTTCWFHAGPDDLAMTMEDTDGVVTWGWRAVRRPSASPPDAGLVAAGR